MSWQMSAVAGLMRATRKRRFADPDGAAALLVRPKADPSPPRRVRRAVTVVETTVAGFAVPVVTRRGTPSGERPVVVYLHGGAYVSEIAPQHWGLVAEIADLLDVEVQVPLYGLAPAHDALEAHALVADVVAGVRASGRTVQLAGDSAGGGLALAVAQQVGRHDPGVTGLTLLAPWLDLRMTNPDIPAVERVDPWLARAALHEVGRVWAGSLPLDDPRVSPLLGPVDGLPPVALWVGTRDITLPDTRLLRDRLAGTVEVTCTEAPGAIHVFPILPVPEAREARARILRTVAKRAATVV